VVRQNEIVKTRLTPQQLKRKNRGDMPDFLLGLFRVIWMLTKGHRALALENLALRQQLPIFKRRRKRPRLNRSDRVFWMVLAKVWKDWRQPWSWFTPIPWCVGSGSVFDDIGQTCR
jgi:hypothetical protein